MNAAMEAGDTETPSTPETPAAAPAAETTPQQTADVETPSQEDAADFLGDAAFDWKTLDPNLVPLAKQLQEQVARLEARAELLKMAKKEDAELTKRIAEMKERLKTAISSRFSPIASASDAGGCSAMHVTSLKRCAAHPLVFQAAFRNVSRRWPRC